MDSVLGLVGWMDGLVLYLIKVSLLQEKATKTQLKTDVMKIRENISVEKIMSRKRKKFCTTLRRTESSSDSLCRIIQDS